MPRAKLRGAPDKLRRWQREALLGGFPALYWFEAPPEWNLGRPESRSWATTDAGRAAWRVHGRRLTQECAKKYPGQRPFAWWAWNYRGPRPWDEPPRRGAGWHPEYHAESPGRAESFAVLRDLGALHPGEAEKYAAMHAPISRKPEAETDFPLVVDTPDTVQ